MIECLQSAAIKSAPVCDQFLPTVLFVSLVDLLKACEFFDSR